MMNLLLSMNAMYRWISVFNATILIPSDDMKTSLISAKPLAAQQVLPVPLNQYHLLSISAVPQSYMAISTAAPDMNERQDVLFKFRILHGAGAAEFLEGGSTARFGARTGYLSLYVSLFLYP